MSRTDAGVAALMLGVIMLAANIPFGGWVLFVGSILVLL